MSQSSSFSFPIKKNIYIYIDFTWFIYNSFRWLKFNFWYAQMACLSNQKSEKKILILLKLCAIDFWLKFNFLVRSDGLSFFKYKSVFLKQRLRGYKSYWKTKRNLRILIKVFLIFLCSYKKRFMGIRVIGKPKEI